MSDNGFRFGDWQINPDSNTLCQGTTTTTVEPKAMDVLRYLCRHPGAVIPPEELLQACWGNAELGDNPIHKAITQLRRALGDSASDPRYIETVRKRGYRAIAPVMAAEDLQEGSWQQGSPFRGLESFQESHASIFFGRMQATAQLRELVLNRASDGCAMALVLGPSGSGKTSLVRAGLLPRLMASRTGSGEPVALACTLYMDCADLADGNLFQALAAVLMDAEIDGKLVFDGENAEELGRWLESSDPAAIAGRLAEVAGKIKIGVFVDRLEAIFRAPGVTDEMRSRFIAVLEHLASSRAVLVMLACRNDFYPEVIALPALMALKARGGHFDLNPPDGADIAQMVRMPAKAAGLKFEVDPATGAALDDVLCDAARGSPDTLPLLQYCLDELYRQRSEDGTLRFEVFRQLGGIEGAIAVRAEEVAQSVPPQVSAELPRVLSLLVGVADTQNSVTARRSAWHSLQSAEARSLVQALIDARLFVSELSGITPCFGIAHEALLRQWPRAAEWINKHRHAIQIRTRISEDANRWIANGRTPDLLIPRGVQVNQAYALLTMEGFSLSTVEKDYIQVSNKKAKFGERMKLAALLIITALAILAITLGVLAKRSQANAEAHRNEAENLMGYMLGEFAEKLRPLGKLDLLSDVSKKALEYLTNDATANENLGQTTLLHRAKALQVIAEVNVSQSNPSKAIEVLQVARDILKQELKADINNISMIKNIGENSFWLGQTYLNLNQLDDAERYFNEYKFYAEKFSSLTGNGSESLAEQSYAYSNLGTVALARRELAKAADLFFKSVQLKQKVLKNAPNNPKVIADLANGISWLADAEAKLGKLHHAIELHQEEQELLKPLLNSRDAKWDYLTANSLWHQGELKLALGSDDDGKNDLQSSERIFEKITNQDPNNRSWKISFYTVKLRLYEQLISNGDRSLIDQQLSLIENLEQLRNYDPKRTRSAQLLAWGHQSIAENYLKLDNIKESISHADQAIQILYELEKSSNQDVQLGIRLANSLLLRSEIERINGNRGAMLRFCTKAQTALKNLEGTKTDYYFLSPLIIANTCAGKEDAVKNEVTTLQDMNYRNSRYIEYISSHSHSKGTQ